MTETLPRVRDRVECVTYIQPGLDGRPARWCFVVDYVTGARFAVSTLQAEVFAALRRCGASGTVAQVQREVRVGAGLVADEAAIRGLVADLVRLGLTGPLADAQALTEGQLAARRAAHTAQQRDALAAFFSRVTADVPHYQDLLRDGLEPARDAAELVRFPILTKAALRAALPRLQPRWLAAERCSVRYLSSSGTTDARTQTLHLTDELMQPYSMGFSALGLSPAADSFRIAYLIPPICSGTECHMDMRLPYERRVTPSGRLLYLNSFRDPSTVAPEAIEAVLAELEAFAPSLLAFDAAYAAPVTRRVLETGRRLPSVKAIITSYGVSSRLHTDLLLRAFGVPIHDLYSMTEAGPVAASCAAGPYHVFGPCVVEIVDAEGHPVAPGAVGRLLVTTLENQLTPLLRYETGDLARAADGGCGCSLAHTDVFAGLEGRTSDLITDGRGGSVTPRALDRVVVAGLAPGALEYYELIQRAARDHLLVVVPGPDYDARVEAALRERLLGLLGEDVTLSLEARRSLPPATNGKYRLCHREG